MTEEFIVKRRAIDKVKFHPQVPTCPECQASHVAPDQNNAYYVCSKCGRNLGTCLYEGTEWRTFESDGAGTFTSNPNRIGGPSNSFIDETDIGNYDNDIDDDAKFYDDDITFTTLISSSRRLKNRDQLDFLKIHAQNLKKNERILSEGFSALTQLSALLNFPKNVTNFAKQVYKDISKAKELEHKNIRAISAVILWIVSSKMGFPRGYDEICKLGAIDQHALSTIYKKVRRIIQKEKKIPSLLHLKYAPSATLNQYIPKFCSELSIVNFEYIKYCQFVAQIVQELGICESRRPTTLGGAVIYFTGRLFQMENPPSLQMISEKLKAAESTIISAFNQLKTNIIQIFEKLEPELQNKVSLDKV